MWTISFELRLKDKQSYQLIYLSYVQYCNYVSLFIFERIFRNQVWSRFTCFVKMTCTLDIISIITRSCDDSLKVYLKWFEFSATSYSETWYERTVAIMCGSQLNLFIYIYSIFVFENFKEEIWIPIFLCSFKLTVEIISTNATIGKINVSVYFHIFKIYIHSDLLK